jgi:hypothetical protein
MEPLRSTEVRETLDSRLISNLTCPDHSITNINQVLSEIATILNTGLDRETVALCISLCERGVNPEALAVSYSQSLLLQSILKPTFQPIDSH